MIYDSRRRTTELDDRLDAAQYDLVQSDQQCRAVRLPRTFLPVRLFIYDQNLACLLCADVPLRNSLIFF